MKPSKTENNPANHKGYITLEMHATFTEIGGKLNWHLGSPSSLHHNRKSLGAGVQFSGRLPTFLGYTSSEFNQW